MRINDRDHNWDHVVTGRSVADGKRWFWKSAEGQRSPAVAARGLRERAWWTACSLVVIGYSLWVLAHVAWMGTIGVRCMFGTKVEEEVPEDYTWRGGRPQKDDSLLAIGEQPIARSGYVGYAQYIRAMRGLRYRIGQTIEVRWLDHATGSPRAGLATVQYP